MRATFGCHSGCKGTGHTLLECINEQKRRREKSLIGIDEGDSEGDSEDEELNNFVAFIGITEFVEGETDTEDDHSDKDTDILGDYRELRETIVDPKIYTKNLIVIGSLIKGR
ncbi:hypothetical protein DY000_02053570 [Brassica cretica]|uniref:Uncharacterized protein n=1 Tax=Brassica cretica TaxID=69181 RepID=A0ABQ7A554_BRACR|nr:hypothetical protein DY000_02053570 [Brassica cretica]